MSDISKKLAAIEKSIGTIRENMATKADIRNMATKDDLKDMATKNDLKNLELKLKSDIRNMATKADMKNLEVKLLEKIDESQMEIIAAVDRHKADKETVEVLEKRVERLEDNAGLPPLTTQ